MKTSPDPHDSHFVPADEAEATQRFERVSGLGPEGLAALTKEELLIPWWSFFWFNSTLHPDDAEVWPLEVADALPLAAEALRRYKAGEIEDG